VKFIPKLELEKIVKARFCLLAFISENFFISFILVLFLTWIWGVLRKVLFSTLDKVFQFDLNEWLDK
jgi:hypothetical protein